MSVEAVEFIEIFEALPIEKKIEVTDFARFLFEKSEDNRWEQIINGENHLSECLLCASYAVLTRFKRIS